MAKFLIDAQLPPALARSLSAAGHDAAHVNDIGLGAAKDELIAAEAERRKALLVTKDEDFVIRANLGLLSIPIIWIRMGNTTNRALWERLEPVLPKILAAIDQGEAVVEVV